MSKNLGTLRYMYSLDVSIRDAGKEVTPMSQLTLPPGQLAPRIRGLFTPDCGIFVRFAAKVEFKFSQLT